MKAQSRTFTERQWVPRFAALVTALVGLANVLSVVTPVVTWRGWRSNLLVDVVGVQIVRISYAIAVAAGAVFLVVAPYLLKRRRRALNVAIGVMIVLGVVSVFKGLDVEGVILHWAVAALLYRARDEFTVTGEPITLRSAVWRVPLIGAFGVALVAYLDNKKKKKKKKQKKKKK